MTAASGFRILAHEWNYACFGPWRLIISVAAKKSIMFGAFSSFCSLPSPPSAFHCYISVTGSCLPGGVMAQRLGCQVLPAIGAVSILELAANSGSSRMSHALNLHIATQLFTLILDCPRHVRDHLRLVPLKNQLRGDHLGVLTGMLKFTGIIVHRHTNRRGQRTQLKIRLAQVPMSTYGFLVSVERKKNI